MSSKSHGRRTHTVVGIAKWYQIVSSSVQTSHGHGQIISFWSAVHKIDNLVFNQI